MAEWLKTKREQDARLQDLVARDEQAIEELQELNRRWLAEEREKK